MEQYKGKISCRQALLLFISIVYPNLLWWFPGLFSEITKQAAWLIPIPGTIMFIYLAKQLHYLLVKNPNLSLLTCIEKYTNKFVGKLYGILIAIYILFSTADSVRYVSEGLLSSIFPNVKFVLFPITILIVISLILKYSLAVIAKMNEIMVFILTIIILILIIALIPNVSIAKITPISYLDIIPVIKSSLILAKSSLLIVITIFILGDKIINKQNFMKYVKQTSIIYLFISILFFIGIIGKFGHVFIQNSTFFLLVGSKYLSILDVITGLDSLFVITLLFGEIIATTIYLLSFLRVIKYIFNIKHSNLFINIMLILTFAYSNLVGKNIESIFEFDSKYMSLLSYIIAIIPIIIVWIDKIKLAIKKRHSS